MGIDIHAFNFLKFIAKKKVFKTTATIGRQGLHVPASIYCSSPDEMYCETLFRKSFGSTSTDSIDNSSFENATHILDMNRKLPDDLMGKYDTVVDAGCLEHIYNAPQALINCSLMCKPGAQIIHILPSNNFCGHGFWQFSPELFFSLYSDKNGYSNTEVYLADLTDNSRWYKVIQPTNGDRVNVYSSTKTYVLVRTILTKESFSHENVQQSDYVYEWENSKTTSLPTIQKFSFKEMLRRNKILFGLLSPLYRIYINSHSSEGLSKNNPGLEVIELDNIF